MIKKCCLAARVATIMACLMAFNGVEVTGEENKPLRFGIAAMVSPKETISTYRQILYYLAEQLDMPVEMVQRKNYAAMDELLRDKDVQIAMLCSGPYVADHDEFGAELLVAPVMYGKSFYHSYLIVHKDSEMEGLEGLRGKVFAYTDPKSNTGCIVPTYMLEKIYIENFIVPLESDYDSVRAMIQWLKEQKRATGSG